MSDDPLERAQRVVLGALLEAHPGPLSRNELAAMLGDPISARDADNYSRILHRIPRAPLDCPQLTDANRAHDRQPDRDARQQSPMQPSDWTRIEF